MRKRLYTALSTSDPVLTDPAGMMDTSQHPVPVIHNIVSTAQIESSNQKPLDLNAISRILPGSSYDRAKFAAMTIRLSNPNCTLLLFSSGKLVVTGVCNWYEGVLSCLYVSRLLQSCMTHTDFRLRNCDIQNIVAHVEIPVGEGSLDLKAMYSRLNLHCTYQSNLFPGLIYRPPSSPIVLLCFKSGKIVITGGKNERDVMHGWRHLWPTVRVFVHADKNV